MIITVDMILFTESTNNAITSNILQKHLDVITAELLQIVQLIRGELTKIQRGTLGVLVVQGVHNKDIVKQLHD